MCIRDRYTLGYMVNREDDASAMFLGGNLVFYEAGTWTNATLMQVEGLNYDCIMMPVFSPETALCRAGTHTWMQPENEAVSYTHLDVYKRQFHACVHLQTCRSVMLSYANAWQNMRNIGQSPKNARINKVFRIRKQPLCPAKGLHWH